jgi:hypothetical protein
MTCSRLFLKENLAVNHFHNFYIVCFLVSWCEPVALFFAGGYLLLAIFA